MFCILADSEGLPETQKVVEWFAFKYNVLNTKKKKYSKTKKKALLRWGFLEEKKGSYSFYLCFHLSKFSPDAF